MTFRKTARAGSFVRAMLAAVLVTAMPAVQAAPKARSHLDLDAMARQWFGNDAAWYRGRIPFFQSYDTMLD